MRNLSNQEEINPNQENINPEDILGDSGEECPSEIVGSNIELNKESNIEQQENEIDVKTVEDFIESLKWSYNVTEDSDIRQKLGIR